MTKRGDPLSIVGQHIVRRPRAASGQSFTEHGWITRYDERFDQYTLFVPQKGADVLLRGDIVQAMSTEEIVLCRDDQDAFPPPLEDHASRYVGVPMMRERDGLTGRVVCFLPFDGLYKVAYPDFSSHDVTENEIINSMIDVVTTAQASLDEQQRRQRLMVQEPHADILELSRTTRSGRSDVNSRFVCARSASAWTKSATTSSTVASTAAVVTPVGMAAVLRPVGRAMEPRYQRSAKGKVVTPSLLLTEHPRASVSEQPEEAETMVAFPMEVSSEEDEELAADDAVMTVNVDDNSDHCDLPPFASISPAFYIIDKPPHEATKPFKRRARAYECLRYELLNVLDRREAGAFKSAMQYDVLKNPDIKDRDSIRRFMDAKGLVVVNALITLYMDEERPDHNNLLHMIKILAIMPPPTEHQVMESSVGKTIGRLTKARSPDSTSQPLPKAITQLSRWIKARWIQAIKRDPNLGKAKPKLKRQRRSNIEKRNRIPAPKEPSERTCHDQVPIPRTKRRAAAPPAGLDSTTGPLQSPARPQIAMGPARKSTLKPDWMRQTENLSQTRFSINTDSTAEYDHYKRDLDSRTGFRLPNTNGGVYENENDSASGGNRGVYGRSQRLSFGNQWSVCEFSRDAAPSLVHPDIAKLPKDRLLGSFAPPRPILRKKSKYTSLLDSF